MAAETYVPPPTSTRLWSEEVAIAQARDPSVADLDPTKEPGYEFSNGRKFNTGNGPYEPIG